MSDFVANRKCPSCGFQWHQFDSLEQQLAEANAALSGKFGDGFISKSAAEEIRRLRAELEQAQKQLTLMDCGHPRWALTEERLHYSAADSRLLNSIPVSECSICAELEQAKLERSRSVKRHLEAESDLKQQLAEAQAAREEATSARKHTWEWDARHYGKLEDWARTRLPEPWRTEFFSCIANGLFSATEDTGKPYMSQVGPITPCNYFSMGAQEAMLFDQMRRAEEAEAARERAEAKCTEMYAALRMADDALSSWFSSEYCEHEISKSVRKVLMSDNPGQPLLDKLARVEALIAKWRKHPSNPAAFLVGTSVRVCADELEQALKGDSHAKS